MKSVFDAVPAAPRARELRKHGLRLAKALAVLASCGGCTSLLGIDGEYVASSRVGDASSGSGGQGGDTTSSGGSGGATADTGGGGGTDPGATGGDGAVVTGCTVGDGTCPTGQKCCAGVDGTTTYCTVPEPTVGCSLTSCDRCPQPPDNATEVCNADHQCDIHCNNGFARAGGTCIAVAGTGGATGQGGAGTGGTTAANCVASACPSSVGAKKGCTIASPFGCCKSDNTCGCTWVTTGSSSAYCL